MTAPLYRLVLIDNHPLYMEGLTQRIGQTQDMRVVGSAADSETGLQAALEHQPDVIVIQIEIPGRGALALADSLSARLPASRVLFVGDDFSDVLLDEALRLNAVGYLLTSEPSAKVIDALRGVCRGETAFSPEVAARLAFDSDAGRFVAKYHNDLAMLSNRQLAVLRHLARGETVRGVAQTMALSERAVESHKYRIMRRLGIRTRVELARYAIREGLTVP